MCMCRCSCETCEPSTPRRPASVWVWGPPRARKCSLRDWTPAYQKLPCTPRPPAAAAVSHTVLDCRPDGRRQRSCSPAPDWTRFCRWLCRGPPRGLRRWGRAVWRAWAKVSVVRLWVRSGSRTALCQKCCPGEEEICSCCPGPARCKWTAARTEGWASWRSESGLWIGQASPDRVRLDCPNRAATSASPWKLACWAERIKACPGRSGGHYRPVCSSEARAELPVLRQQVMN